MLPQIVTVNPMSRKKRAYRSKNRHHKHRYSARRRVHNAHRRHGRRRLSNPLKLPAMGGLEHQLMPALIGGAGAIGVDIGLAYAAPYLPAFLQSGWGRIAAQIAAAVGLGYGAGKVLDRETGKAVMVGALTITAYSALRQVLAPTIGANVKGLSGLADFGDFTPTNWSGGYAVGANLGYVPRRVGAYMQQGAYMAKPGMGAYMANPRLGYMNPGAILTGLRQKQMAGLGRFAGHGLGENDSEGMFGS